ncbi:MAG: LamG-like jellyroll fold domain-containing protein, partial [Verrucomicrobiota bacterium]
SGTNLVGPGVYPGYYNGYGYGNDGGTNYPWNNGSLITVANPGGSYNLTVYGAQDNTGDYPDDSYVLRVRAMAPPPLSFSPELDSGGLTNVASEVLADTEHAFYVVTVPGVVNGAPVLGWKLDLTAVNGSPTVRVRQNLLPDNTCDTSMYGSGTVIIAAPYLTPGTWYVDVQGSGSTAFALTSSAITTNTLAHLLWVMPPAGQTNTAPGLVFPAIGDSGIDSNGNRILDPQTGTVTDQGIDLKQGHFDIYAVVVPTNNAALLRTELQAISGNPNLYLRVGAAPTLNHYAQGSCDWWDPLMDRQLTGGTTEYGNWVPLNGRYEAALTPGIWVLAVQAGGNANARYRLQLSCGNAVSNGLVQNLDLGSGSYTNQNLSGGDWRYYRVQIPDPAPSNWVVSWTRSLGSARMFVRDTVPPGDGNNPADFSNTNNNPGPGSTDLQTWNSDAKNEGPYPRFDTPGTAVLSTPPLRPGSVYYLGFWSPVDTTFAVSSSTNGGAVIVTNVTSFLGGTIAGNIPGYGSVIYRVDVPANATRLLFNASNTTDIIFSVEQGTIALAGGPAHWTSYLYNNPQYGGQSNVVFDQFLSPANTWPWQPGYSYYLAVTNTSANAENFGVFLALPADLAPVAFTAPSSVISAAPNPAVQAVWCVTNRGIAATAGAWYDTVWFSTNGVLDGNSINIGNFYCPGGYWSPQAVPPGGSYWQTNTVALPMTQSGNYTLFVQADAGNSIYEASLSDKVSNPINGTFTLIPPDLMPISVAAPGATTAAQANPTVQVSWVVTNQGIGAASGGWYDGVWFSTNGALDALSVDIGDFYINQTVAPTGTYAQTNTVTLPISLGGTNHYALFVQVDIYDWVYESNKSNNVWGPVPGTLMLDLPPTIVTQPLSQFLATGGTAIFSVAANGTPPLRYQWQCNNAILNGATNMALTLNSVQPTNDGSYAVVITNAFGAVTSRVASLLVAGPGTNCVSAPAGLIGWWPGEGNANDVMGGNNGTPVNGVSFAPGKVGQAFSFNGANQYVSIVTTNALAGTFTLEFWMMPMNLNNTLGVIGSRGPQDGSYDMQLNGGSIHGDIGNGSSWITTSADAAYTFSAGNWYHIASVVTPTNYAIYVNGVVVGSGSYSYNTPLLFDANHLLEIGYIGNYGEYMNGLMDEVSVYNRALSFDEIAEIYLAGAYGKCESVAPTILTQPQSQVVLNGSNVTFSVSAVGQQPLYYFWQRNGTNLADAGNIAGSANASLVVSNISSSDVGIYSVVVSNTVGFVTSTGAVLALNVVQNGGFETGNLNGWTQSGNTTSTSLSGSSAYCHSGSYGLEAGPSGSLGYLAQTLPTSAGESYLLSFWFDCNGGNPNEFLVVWNGNTLFDQTNIPGIGWTNMQFVVTATGTHTVLEFGFRDDPSYFGLDDISVVALSAAPPRLASAGFSSDGTFQLMAYGQTGQAYTLQASTNLTSWISLLTFTCTNSPMSVADPTAKNFGRRFYRLVQGTVLAPITIGFGSAQPWTTHGLSLMLQGTMGQSYVIQASTNLVNWQPITNFVSTNWPVYFYDPTATNFAERFYRVKLGP